MPSQMTRPRHLSLSLLALALFGSFTHVADTTAQTSELQPVIVKGADLLTHCITTQKIVESTDTDLKGLLLNKPSIGFGGGSDASQWVNIRGLDQDQIDFKVDDSCSDTSTSHHQSRFLLDPELVKVVAVQKGPGLASAGIGASSDAIVTETIDPSGLLRPDQNFGLKVNAGASSNKGWNRGLSFYGCAAGFDALVTGDWITEKNYKAGKGYVDGGVSGGNRIPFSALSQRGLSAKASYSINEDNRIELGRSQKQTHGTRTLREEFDDLARNPASYRTYTQDRTNLGYEGANLGFVSNIRANVFRLKTARKDAGSSADRNKATGTSLNLDSRIFDRHTLKYGVSCRYQKNHPSTTAAVVNESKTDYGIYTEGIWEFHPVTLTTGLRYDHFKINTIGHASASDGNINPSLGLTCDVTDSLSLKASHSYATRGPHPYESMLAPSRNIITAPNLKAECSRTTEIGFNYHPIRDLSLIGGCFWQKIDNVHDFTCLSGSCTGGHSTYTSDITQSTNNGYIKNKGYESGANCRQHGLTARMGVVYSDPRRHYSFDSYDINTKAHAVGRTWAADLAYRFDRPNLEIGWRGRFIQSRIGKPDRGATVNGGTTEKRAGYGVNNIYANWKPTGKDDLNINFAISSVGNKYYYSHSQHGNSRSDDSLPEVEHDFRLTMNYKF